MFNDATIFKGYNVHLGWIYLVVNCFRIFEIKYFYFVVAILDLVHDLEAIHVLC